MMRIQHNMSAMHINRFFGMNQKLICKNEEKLSSGYRINRAGDDAAGLSISEKMRNQIRGLNQAAKNIEDGISLIQTAEGALNETHSILGRIRELAVKAANDTNCWEDRQTVQDEVDQLVKEVDDIAYKTEFNRGIHPLLGTDDPKSLLHRYLTQITATVTAPVEVIYDGITYNPGNSFTVTGVLVENYNSPARRGYFCMGYLHGAIYNKSDLIHNFSQESKPRNFPYYTITSDNFGVDEGNRIYCQEKSKKTYFTDNNGYISYAGDFPNLNADNILRINPDDACPNLWIQSGANAGEGTMLSFVDATAAAIGIKGISVMSNGQAGNAIWTVDGAMKKVSEYRSVFGAQQNRLERTMSANMHYCENLQGAESKLRDTDIAEEMRKYVKQSILLQAGQAFLAQANKNPQAVLGLL